MMRSILACYLGLVLIGLITIWPGPKPAPKPELEPNTEVYPDPAGVNLTQSALAATTTESESMLTASVKEAKAKDDPSERASVTEMLLSKQFILLYIMNVLSLFTGFFVVGQTVNFGEVIGFKDTQFLSLVASIGAIFNSIRFLWSWALDHY